MPQDRSKDVSQLLNPTVQQAADRLAGSTPKCPVCGTPFQPSISMYNNMEGVFIQTITCPRCFGEWISKQEQNQEQKDT